GHAALVNANDRLLQILWVPPYSYRMLRSYNFILQPAAFIRRSAIESTSLVDEEFDGSMDRELWLRLGRRHRMKRVDALLAIDRHHLARKSVARPDLLQGDASRLADIYGTRTGWPAKVAEKVVW